MSSTSELAASKNQLVPRVEPGIWTFLGRRWYYSLKSTRDKPISWKGYVRGPGLFDFIDEKAIASRSLGVDGGLLICYNPLGKSHVYSFFNSIDEFIFYANHIAPEDRCFFEVVIGYQKMKFDIDVKTSDLSGGDTIQSVGPRLRNGVVKAVFEVYKDLGVTLLPQNIIVHDSHIMSSPLKPEIDGKPSTEKRSYHIVVDGYAFEDHLQTKEVFKRCMSKMSSGGGRTLVSAERYVKCIDASVYKSIQQFRVEGSRKYESGRPKMKSGFEHEGKVHDCSSSTFPQSLSSYVKDCFLLKVEVASQAPKIVPQEGVEGEDVELSADTVACAVKLLWEMDKGVNFEVSAVDGRNIILKRLHASHCMICKRTHEHDNAYLSIIGNCIFLYCRRASGTGKHREYLGDTTPASKRLSLGVSSSATEAGEDKDEGPSIIIGGKSIQTNLTSEGWQAMFDPSLSTIYKDVPRSFSERTGHIKDGPKVDTKTISPQKVTKEESGHLFPQKEYLDGWDDYMRETGDDLEYSVVRDPPLKQQDELQREAEISRTEKKEADISKKEETEISREKEAICASSSSISSLSSDDTLPHSHIPVEKKDVPIVDPTTSYQASVPTPLPITSPTTFRQLPSVGTSVHSHRPSPSININAPLWSTTPPVHSSSIFSSSFNHQQRTQPRKPSVKREQTQSISRSGYPDWKDVIGKGSTRSGDNIAWPSRIYPKPPERRPQYPPKKKEPTTTQYDYTDKYSIDKNYERSYGSQVLSRAYNTFLPSGKKVDQVDDAGVSAFLSSLKHSWVAPH